MPYTVTSFDGNFTIDALTINTANSSLALVGKNFAGWGEPYANNFEHLLENFAGDNAPANLRTGQLWYDTLNRKLKIWDTRDNAWAQLGANAITAQHLLTPRNIALSGDATGSTSFDGSTDTTITVTLATLLTGVGATANSAANIPGVIYNSPAIVVDSKGRITSITNTGGDGAAPPTYVSTFNTRSGAVTLNAQDIHDALGYTPTNGGLTTLSASDITTALGYVPVNKAGDNLTGNGDTSGNTTTHGLDLNYGPISHAGNITTYGNLRMGNGGKQTDFAGNKLSNVGTPTAGTDGATKAYVDAKLSGNVTVSSFPPSGGSDGDVWYRY